ncbi:sensor histidine kinase [Clostridium sp.]|uniref:sensor histidine kinase n=1 Tax=Clostridium sp. TaxID=1506 RepID=UPI003D6D090F
MGIHKENNLYINQHFLFNTLNGILALCRQDPEEARKVVLELTSYLRFNFNAMEEIVFLYEEIEYIKSYLYIQKVRFGQRLNYKCFIQEDVNFLIPKDSLYNLIDNAINHGILKKNQGGNLTFIVKKDKEGIVIEINDDGVGMEEKQIMETLHDENCGSIATSTCKYSELYKAKLEVISKLNIGTHITIYIPMENIKCV